MIVRLADSFGWEVPPWELLLSRAPALLDGRYLISSVGRR